MATGKGGGGSRLFGGLNLKDVATQVRDRGEGSPLERSSAQPTLAAAELALKGRAMPSLERENIHAVDPKRCRPWKFHNRTDAWYTRERCQDLIDSIVKDGQLEPALARRLEGDKDYDFELIFGMRRRFACEATGQKLKVRVVDADDARAAVLMHIENADRQDITPMERAISFQVQAEARLFATQEAMAEALGVSKGQVAKMIKAAALLKNPGDPGAVSGPLGGAGGARLQAGRADGAAGGEGGRAQGGADAGQPRRRQAAAGGGAEEPAGESRSVEVV